MSNQTFTIELLPANQGDAIWVEYGKKSDRRRMMIDGGPIDAWPDIETRLMKLKEGDKRVELAVITHVDTDHIEGMIRMFAEKRQKWPIAPEDIWFNGYRHMKESAVLGGREGDFLSALLHHRAFDKWNKKFGNQAVAADPSKELPIVELEGGMKITLLSPSPAKLKSMANKWIKDSAKHNLKPGDLEKAWEQFLGYTKLHPDEGILGGPGEMDEEVRKQLKTDQSAANGSSIAFLAEYGGKSCLFLADAHHSVITAAIKKLIPPGETRLKVDAVKVSHHGSRNNISKAMMELIDARHFLISSSGAKHNHPDEAAVKAIIQGSLQDPVIWFNYSSEQTLIWKKKPDASLRKYKAKYPPKGKSGVTIDLFKVYK